MNKISGQATLAVYCSSIIFCLNRTLAYWFSTLRLISQFLQLRLSNNINPAYNGCNILLTNNIMLSILLSLSFFIWVWESIGNIALTSFNALHNWFVRAITNSNHFILPIRRKANTTYAWRLLSFSSLTNMFVLCCRYHCRSFVTRVYPDVPVACHFVRRRIKIASTNKNCVQVTISNVLQEWNKNKVLPMSF